MVGIERLLRNRRRGTRSVPLRLMSLKRLLCATTTLRHRLRPPPSSDHHKSHPAGKQHGEDDHPPFSEGGDWGAGCFTLAGAARAMNTLNIRKREDTVKNLDLVDIAIKI